MQSPDASNTTRAFKRSYVACVSCRVRKSRCIIKDKPPCAKCAREHRECQFDHKPRAPKHREAPKWTQRDAVAKDGEALGPQQQALPMEMHQANTSPRGLDLGLRTYHAPQGEIQVPAGFTTSPTNTNLYDRVRSTIVTGTNDALDILSDAAGQQHSIAGSTPSQQQPQPANNTANNTGPRVVSGGYNGLGFAITALSEPDDACLDMWDKCRFVRQGCFTAQEAVTYLDL